MRHGVPQTADTPALTLAEDPDKMCTTADIKADK